MPKRASGRLAQAIFLVSLLWSASAFSWIETAVRAHSARIEVSEDGSAIVRHELTLNVRGGPMKSLEVGGVGTSLEPLADATVRRAIEGSSGMWPLSLASMEDGALRLQIGSERGIRGGSYIFSFGYRIDLAAAGLIRSEAEGVLVEWVGPRLSGGVDSARVTFILPSAPSAPRLFEDPENREAQVLLGEVRRGSEQDEIDLVRAHLATGEPAVWQVLTDASALAQLVASGSSSHAVAPTPRAATFPQRGPQTGGNWFHLALSVVTAFVMGALLLFKERVLKRSARLTRARLLPLLPLPGGLRAGAGALTMGAYVGAVLSQHLWAALGALTLCLLVGTHLLPVRRVVPRGPGRWELLDGEARGDATLPGPWLDARSFRGVSLLLLLLGSIFVVAIRVLPESNYLALMTLLAGLALCPVFLTGCRRDFPRSPLAQAEPWLQGIVRGTDPALARWELWGRRVGVGVASAEGGSGAMEVDECRIRCVPASVPPGLKACELTLEEAAGAHVLPCVLLRVVADSPAQMCLPVDVAWRRGRSADERVALLRPAAPTLAQSVRLLRSLLKTFAAARNQSRAARSAGKSATAVNGAMPGEAPRMAHA